MSQQPKLLVRGTTMDVTAAEQRFLTLQELGCTLDTFAIGHSSDRDLAARFIALRASNLKREVDAVLKRQVDTIPEIVAGMKELRLTELRERRRELSRQIDALDAEERGIRAVDKSA
ncbi:hypothetical protein [Bradyrhizobium sp.]|uniref:hypothetical protein n=1 Tax=Bradyrhizobium sp. TaxID=376 RepID=UPI0039E43A36